MPTAAALVPPTPPPSRTLAASLAAPSTHTAHRVQSTEDEIPQLPAAKVTSSDVHANNKDIALGSSDASGSGSTLDENDNPMQAVPEDRAEMEATVEYGSEVDVGQVAEWTTGGGYIYDDPDAESMCSLVAGSMESCIYFALLMFCFVFDSLAHDQECWTRDSPLVTDFLSVNSFCTLILFYLRRPLSSKHV